MTRPHSSSRPPPVPPQRTPESRRQGNSRSVHAPRSPYPNNAFQPVSRSQSRASTITRSFSSGSQLDEPDNTAIIRGAQLLRERLMNNNHKNEGGGKVSTSPERLFTSKNDAVLQDLLGIEPMHPPGSPNDVTFQFFSQDWLPDWSDQSWSISGSAFDRGSTAAVSPPRQEHRNHHHHHHHHPDNTLPPGTTASTSRRTSPDVMDHSQRQKNGNYPRENTPAGPEPRLRSPRTLVSQRTSPTSGGRRGKPPRDERASTPLPAPASPPVATSAKAKSDPLPVTPATSPADKKSNSEWQTTASFPTTTDMDDSNPWGSLSEQNSSMDTGPRSKETGPDPLTDMKEAEEALLANGLQHHELVHQHDGDMIVQVFMTRPDVVSDARAFDEFIETTSLDDKAFEELIDSKEYDGEDREGVWPIENREHIDQSMMRDDQLQSRAKQQGNAVARTREVALTRGRPQRSYSIDVLPNTTVPKRSHSAGVERRQYNKRNHQRHVSSLRDDLLCGMETNCNTKYTTEPIPIVIDQSRLLEAPCTCPQLEEQPTTLQSKPGKKERSHHIHKGRPLQDHDAILNDRKHHEQRHLSKHRAEDSAFPESAIHNEGNGFGVLSPESNEYMALQRTDLAFQHAMKAGGLWQALVGNHVRFPKHWWQGGYRTAPMGCPRHLAGKNKWVYYDRHRIKGNKFLNRCVRKRDAAGQLLLHLVVRDFMLSSPILDIAIGCFHPNARSVRVSQNPNPRNDDCRDVWMATRFRTEDVISVIDPLFFLEKMGQPKKSPLGDSKRRISNGNVRAIFGETPPLCTVFVQESDIYEDLAAMDGFEHSGPADILLRKYVFTQNGATY
ncbi:expressed unknown protein [Seminavis robusta]|uniref:Uncharacterized protein n=1 Tax=Seminavis robusta TaxID=568900 RepID=A0A9N8H3Q2_9STRA|nr:expressed unknown protein [Seminavis robusta]|eukprot:Sro66_g037230.1 n/a (839) ;mRNA; f:80189-82808